jgi:flagellar hook-length control protein FliK
MNLHPTPALGTAPAPLLPALNADHGGGGAGFADLLVERQAARAADGARPGQRHAFDAAPAPRAESRASLPERERAPGPQREPAPRTARESSAGAGATPRDAAERAGKPTSRQARRDEACRERPAGPAAADRAANTDAPAETEEAGGDPLESIRAQAVIDWFARLESSPEPALATAVSARLGDTSTAADAAGGPDGVALSAAALGARRLSAAATPGADKVEAQAAATIAATEMLPVADGLVAAAEGQAHAVPPQGLAALPATAPGMVAASQPTPLAAAAAANGGAAPLLLSVPVDSAGFPQALASQLTTLARDGVHEATLQLNPAEMGPIAVKIVLDGAQAQIDFAAAHARTREAIESGLPSLAAALHGAGLTLAGGGVYEQHPGRDGEPSPGEGGRGGGPRAAADDDAPAAAAPRRIAVRGLLDAYA